MTEQKFIIIGGLLAAVAVLYLVKKPGAAAGLAQSAGEAAVGVATGAVAGIGLGLGDAIGIPRTDETECEKAKREGRWWDASFACPAGDFISSGAGAATDSISDWWNN